MSPRRSHLLAHALTLAVTATLPAQDTALTRLLIANRHPLAIANGRLEGAGGRRLADESRASRFVMLGEQHGVAEIPVVMGALLRELRPAGFGTLAIEVSPLRGQELDEMTRTGRWRAQLDAMQSSWRTALPFYTLVEERAMLADALDAQGPVPPMRIWGLDYEVSADRQWLAELETLAPPAGRPAIRETRALADSGFRTVARTGNPSTLFLFSAPDSLFDRLRAAFGARPPARAVALIDLMRRSAQINRLFMQGRGYESNLDRSAFLRENFAEALRAAEARGARPRVVFKFGGAHMMRGLTYTNTLDLGTAAAIVAAERREQSYHVLLLGGSGTLASRVNITKLQYEPTGTAEVDDPMFAWLKPALPDSGWVVFDLRAARLAFLRSRRSALAPLHDRYLHAFDAVVVLGGSHAGTVPPLTADP